VTESTNQGARKNWDKPAARIGWAILFVATLYVCYFSHLGAIGFVGPDEPRYAWVARDMVETGDWITPHLYGKPWFEKPPLFYWGAALCFKLFGVSEAAARLPSAISALLATLAMAWLAMRLYGAETARWLLLLLPTTVGMIGFSHAAATDMPFSGMLTIAMVAAAVAIGLARNDNTPIIPRTPWLALVLFGFFLGLAVLAKGPAAIILCGGAVFFWALFTKRWRNAFRLLHPVAIAAFSFTALPWYLLCARRNPDFFRVFLIEHNFKRYLTPEFQHIQPFWYYGPILLAAFFPWIAIFLWSFLPGAVRLLRARSTKESIWFLLCWAGFCFAFFTISRSKLPGYILPALPAIALVLAYSVSYFPSASVRSLVVTLLATAACFGITAGLLLRSVIHLTTRHDSFSPFLGIILFALTISVFLLGLSFLAKHGSLSRALLIASSLSLIFLPLSSAGFFISRANVGSLSSDWLASELLRDEIPIDQLRLLHVSRSYHYSLNYYLHTELKEWKTNPVQDGYVLSDGVYCDQLQTQQKCVDLWGRMDFSSGSWALLRLTSNHLAGSPPRSGQPQ
jgi:4-amino-4-deoxy-L-arabinose transferase-like glycosyltransferase